MPMFCAKTVLGTAPSITYVPIIKPVPMAPPIAIIVIWRAFSPPMQGVMREILRVLGVLKSDVSILLIWFWLGTVIVLSLRRAVGGAIVGVEGRHAGQAVASARYTAWKRCRR